MGIYTMKALQEMRIALEESLLTMEGYVGSGIVLSSENTEVLEILVTDKETESEILTLLDSLYPGQRDQVKIELSDPFMASDKMS